MYALETNNLTKKYGNNTVVDHVSLKVEKGTIFGFLGKNGAGKSTFINMVTGLTIPTEGSFTLSPAEKVNIGVLPDYSTFYDDMTVLGHLKFFSRIMGLKLPKEEMIQILKRVELEDAINVKAKKLSFGMKKKLGIAQALLNNPEILFLDEPTSGVDANSVLNIHSLIKNIASQGTTIFLTSHNLDEVEKLCDEISIMDKGCIKKQGTITQLRNEFQNNLTVRFKHGEIPDEKFPTLEKELSAYETEIEWGRNYVKLVVPDEETISVINKHFIDTGIDVFRIEVDEPSLEEIFLSTGA
ncbi:ABC transporter ATP-binding protein [Halobacillus sp. A5]|uniref:ABC transporter ATP-binding protein n=1 Tax=Halobacillus sp. A5 TaxID=2880263 RepID=UPI0020A68E13|nr:ABC transporter ATP-binding protein [Halobacillus sp. A5]MCP3029500.1 ABC transporter ATP-binding protein [Halobacillus sp. A5]